MVSQSDLAYRPFREITVELEDSGEFRGFNSWARAKVWLQGRLRERFQPFYIQCVEYRQQCGEETVRVVWDVEWTASDMRATREELKMLRKRGAVCVCELFRFA